jgi:hypothetical protein
MADSEKVALIGESLKQVEKALWIPYASRFHRNSMDTPGGWRTPYAATTWTGGQEAGENCRK